MAVFTPVPEEDLKHFLSLYDIGDLVSYEGIEAGVSNTNYFVTTTKDRYVLTLFEPHRVDALELPYFLQYAAHLAKAGIPCPHTLIQTNGLDHSVLCERPAAIFSVLDGEGAHPGMLTPDLCEKGGAFLARMHLASRPMTVILENRFNVQRFSTLSHYGKDRIDALSPGLYDLALNEFLRLRELWPYSLPHGMTHGDYFPDNVFFKDGHITGVIDFHFVSNDLFAYDLAISCNAWSFDERNVFHAERMRALVRGYDSVRPLVPGEREWLGFLCRAAALRFLLSRIQEKLDWKEGDFMKPHDPLVFEKRLRHFKSESISL